MDQGGPTPPKQDGGGGGPGKAESRRLSKPRGFVARRGTLCGVCERASIKLACDAHPTVPAVPEAFASVLCTLHSLDRLLGKEEFTARSGAGAACGVASEDEEIGMRQTPTADGPQAGFQVAGWDPHARSTVELLGTPRSNYWQAVTACISDAPSAPSLHWTPACPVCCGRTCGNLWAVGGCRPQSAGN